MGIVRGVTYYQGEIGDTVIGTSKNDTLYGTDLYGKEGDDLLIGYYTDDFMNGGRGNDTLVGDEGNDHLNGYHGKDFIQGGRGNDTLYGNGGNDTLSGNSGDNFLHGGWGNDLLIAGMSAYEFNGSFGAAGTDTLVGGKGADTFDLRNVFHAHYSEGVFEAAPNFAIIKDFSFQEGDRLRLPETGIRTGVRSFSSEKLGNDSLISANLITGESIELALLINPQGDETSA